MNYPLTNPQNSIWLTEKFYTGTSVNNICGYVYISDAVNFNTLKRAINELARTNDSMRLKFTEENNYCVQYLNKYKEFDIDVIELSSEEEIKQKALEMASIPFEIKDNFLFKFILFKLPNGSGGFIVNIHHIISDSWTLGLIAKEVTGIYSKLLNSNYEEESFPSYLKYIEQEKEYINSDKYIKDREYWNEVFKTVPEVASIPSMKDVSSKNVSCAGSREKFIIPEEQINNIKEFCTKNKISVYNFFMSAYSLYLGRVSNLDDFVIGTPILNRTNFEQKHTMGMFISTAPLRINLDHNLSFTEFSKKVATDTMSILRHQKYPYQLILEDLRKKEASLPNLYNVVLSYQITKTIEENSNIKYSTDWVFNGCCADELQIHLFDLHDEDSITVAYDYKSDKYDSQDITDLHNRILTIINQVIQNNDILLKNIEIVTPEEKHKILYEFNNTKVDYPRDKTIVDLFEEQVEKTPDNIAVEFEGVKITYKDLLIRVNKLSNYLHTRNLYKKKNIGIFTNRTIDTIVGILSILKIGATFVPIDPLYPIDRINHMITSSNLQFILNDLDNTIKLSSNVSIINVAYSKYSNLSDTYKNIKIKPTENLYIIFTSGSTGTPKGLGLSHQNMVNLISFQKYSGDFLSENNNILQFATMSFDVSYQEIFSSLLTGCTLVLIDDIKRKNIDLLVEYIVNHKVSTLFIPPAYLRLLTEDSNNINLLTKTIKYIITAGESLLITTGIKKLLENNIKLFNHYGPAETHVATTYLVPKDICVSAAPIGKPIQNTQIYILDANNNLCPNNVVGQIVISGDCVGNGYVNRADLTKEKFITNIFDSSKTMYLTGDIGFMDKNNIINYIGRNDFQVKINGFRIEPDEINRNILQFNGINSSCTIIKEYNSKKYIISYYTSNEHITEETISMYLSKKLAKYMMPHRLIRLDMFPINANGKIDKKSLPDIDFNTSSEFKKATTKSEKKLLELWKNVLNISDISTNADFFNLGGDSLLAIKLISYINKEFLINIDINTLFDNSTIFTLAKYLDEQASLNNRTIISIKKAKKQDYYPLSSAQKRIYYASSLDNNSVLYNISGGIIVDKLLDVNKLQECFNRLINRHEALRTSFEFRNNDIVQIINDKVDFKLDLDNSTTVDLNKIYYNFVKPFDLSKDSLFRAKAVNLENNKMLLILDMHHIISDGTSLSILLQELCGLYNDNELKENQIDYTDFTLWEKEQFESEAFNKSKEYWLNQFNGEIPLLNMPTNNPRPSIQTFEGSSYHSKLSNELFIKVNKVAKDLNITPYMLMLSCYYILLSKYTSQDDIIVGTPIVGREFPELSNMLGMFINTLALRNKIDINLTFNNFTNIIKENCLNSFKYQDYPFDILIKDLNIKRDTSRSPLFDVMFIYQNNGYPEINFKDIKTEYFIPDNNISKFDLTLEIIPVKDEYYLRFEYCKQLFNEEFIKRFSSHYINILNTILDNNEIKIADIDILSIKEKNQLLYEFNNTKVDYQKNKTIIDLFEEQVEKTPDNIAVVFEDKKITYRNLNEKANQLARHLLENGITENSVVGIMVPRCLEMIISMFAILKTGAAYLPLDPTYPKNRIKYILKDSNVKLLLSKDSFILITSLQINIALSTSNIYNKYPKDNLNNRFSSSNLAYIIYTSGSTGNPKGVTITHRNVNNFIEGIVSKIYFNGAIVSVTTICFDIFVLESILPLQKGLTVVLANESEQTVPQLLNALCLKNNVTMLQTTPSKFSLLISDEDSLGFLQNINTIMLGGEPFPHNLLTKIKSLSKCKIYNMYGPTETTVWSSIKELTNSDTITIGKPISNTTMYVLDNNLNVLPVGLPGTLYIGGDGLSNGYFNREDLTNKKFIINPYNNEKIYNTGDLAKWSSSGDLVCLGRSDFQVKIRGLRIELEEIEKSILSFNGIEKAVVTVNMDSLNRQVLCAYIVSNSRISVSELKQYLGMFLPNYMLPTYIVQLDDFKYTPNGKIDKKLLPTPDYTTDRKRVSLPKTNTEYKILKIWEELLCISPISISDNFFEIGGDSLLALKMQIELLKQNINVTYGEIFKYNTIKKLASLVDKKASVSDLNTDIYSSYDYSNINSVLINNNVSNLNNILYTPIGNVLLTGVTGFLGAHILDYLIKNTDVKIYCLVRKDPSTTLINKVLNKLHFYFGNVYDDLINKRIFIINSDLTKDKLGLTDEKIHFLSDKISCVINSGALVKHYGDYSEFESVNVTSVKKLIDFCKKYNKRLIQISTISVSGNTLTDLAVNTNDFTSDIDFTESDLYIGQSMENVYVRSKFEAEKLILEEVSKNNLDALILRIGNITNRYTDGKFQSNSNENAFSNRIKTFLKIGAIPDYILDKYIEFSPVDYVAKAVVKSIEYSKNKFSVLHIYNHNHVYLNEFINLLPKNYKFSTVTDYEFKNILNNILKNNDEKYILSHLLNDLDDEQKLVYETHIKIKSNFSKAFLEKAGFIWPTINKKYIENLLNNMQEDFK